MGRRALSVACRADRARGRGATIGCARQAHVPDGAAFPRDREDPFGRIVLHVGAMAS
jgi:hypothetical protein